MSSTWTTDSICQEINDVAALIQARASASPAAADAIAEPMIKSVVLKIQALGRSSMRAGSAMSLYQTVQGSSLPANLKDMTTKAVDALLVADASAPQSALTLTVATQKLVTPWNYCSQQDANKLASAEGGKGRLPRGASPPAQTIPGHTSGTAPGPDPWTDEPMVPSHDDAYPREYWGLDMGSRHASSSTAPGPDPWACELGPGELIGPSHEDAHPRGYSPSHEDAYPRGYWGPNKGARHTVGTAPGPDPGAYQPGPGEPRHTDTHRNMSAQADEGMQAATRARNERVLQTRAYSTQEDPFGPSHEHAEPSWYRGPNRGIQHAYGLAPRAPRVYMTQEDAFGPSREHAEPSWKT
jgi:hypothetical protein